MHKFSIHLILASLFFLHGFISVHARTSASGTINRVPMDSVIVLSVDGQEIISKSGILKNKQWKTLLNRIEEQGWRQEGRQEGPRDPPRSARRPHRGGRPAGPAPRAGVQGGEPRTKVAQGSRVCLVGVVVSG